MRVAHVHAAVEALVGEAVSANSVSWVLASHAAGPAALFVRVARGRYALCRPLGYDGELDRAPLPGEGSSIISVSGSIGDSTKP